MKRLLLAAVSSSLTVTAFAQPTFHPSGSNLVYGANSVSQSAITSTANPAAGASALQQEGDTRFRMGLITIGAGYEVGDVDNFVDDLDRLIEKTDALTQAEALAIYQNTPGNLKEEFNTVLPVASENGYFTTTVAAHVPLTPMLIASDMFGGAITIDANVGVEANVHFIDDVVDIDEHGTLYSPFDPNDPTPGELAALVDDTITAGQTMLLVKGGMITELALGYSTSVFTSESGALYAGLKAKMLNVELGRDTVVVDSLATGEDVSDALSDFDQNTEKHNTVTADIGVLWATKNYQLGATLLNVTSPSFKYPDYVVPVDCSLFTGAARQQRCNNAINDNEYNLDAQVRLEGALHSESRNWLITFAYDANETETPTGGLQQWAVVGMGYSPESWIIPGVRAGYRANMTGSELSYATFGLTLFKAVNLDVAYGLESTTIDGDKLPRSAMVNISTELRF